MFENPAPNKYLSKNKIKKIIKYKLYTNVAKDNR